MSIDSNIIIRPVRWPPSQDDKGTPSDSKGPVNTPPGANAGPPGSSAPPLEPHHKRGLDTIRYIDLYGEDPNDPNTYYEFNVLPGDTPPRIVGGYAKQTVIDRPLHRGLTVFQGYDPTSMEISVRFVSIIDGSIDTSDDAGRRVEVDIGKLEWMAGAARLNTPPPFVYLSTTDASGNTSPLIPFEYQFANSPNVPTLLRNQLVWPWIIMGLEWDENPWRNQSAYRVQQLAKVTLMLWGGTQDPPSIAHGIPHRKPLRVVAQKHDTPLSIATRVRTAPGADRGKQAWAIVKYPANQHLHLHGTRSPIKEGTVVWVPYNF